MNFVLAVIVVALSIVRFMIPSHPLSGPGSYEAVAHLVVGFLIGAYVAGRDRRYLWAALALSAVEVVAFFAK